MFRLLLKARLCLAGVILTVVLLSSIRGGVTLEMRAMPRIPDLGDLPDSPPPSHTHIYPRCPECFEVLLSQTHQMQTFPHLFPEVERYGHYYQQQQYMTGRKKIPKLFSGHWTGNDKNMFKPHKGKN